MLFFSSVCINRNNVENALQQLINAGVRNIELGKTKEYIPDVTGILERFKEDYDLNFLIHNYFPVPEEDFVLNLASQNKTFLARTITHCKKAIELADKLNAAVYSIHGGLRLDPHPSELGNPIKQINLVPYEKAYKTLTKSLEILCDYALDFNVEIAVENNVLARFNLNSGKNELLLMCEADEFLQLFKDMRKKNLKVLIDLGHLNITSATLGFDKIDFIERLKDKITLFHISDNNGLEDTHDTINEKSWFWDALGAFRNMRCVIESHNLVPEEIKLTREICRKKLFKNENK